VVPERLARDDPPVEIDRTTNGETDVLACAECRRVSSVTAWRWKAYRTDDIETNELPALAFYCPQCARREFGNI